MNAVTAEFDSNSNSVEALTAKQKSAGRHSFYTTQSRGSFAALAEHLPLPEEENSAAVDVKRDKP